MPRLLADTAPLQNPHFRRLWLANIVTVVGAQLTVVAVPAQIYSDTQSSGYVGLAGLFGLVPLVGQRHTGALLRSTALRGRWSRLASGMACVRGGAVRRFQR